MMNIIGLDCAAQHNKIGLVKAEFVEDKLTIKDAKVGLTDIHPALIEWIADGPCLLCIDAPLGWPKPMVDLLGGHTASQALYNDGNAFFRRETDLHIKRVYNKNPLDIGADRIARVALSALKIIDKLRQSKVKLPLLWSPQELRHSGLIEVYPAATIISHGLSAVGYKGKKAEKIAARRKLFEILRKDIHLCISPNYFIDNEDVFDAFVCALAGLDFIKGRTIAPNHQETAYQEGWIWVKSPLD